MMIAELELWVSKNILWVILGTIAAIFVGYMLWMTFIAPGRAKAEHDAVQVKAQQAVTKAEGAAGQNASNVVAGNSTKETIIHDTTHNNFTEITRQPGAGDLVSDAVDAAGRSAICMRASAASLPDCQRLRTANSN